ncbi:DNA mismatch repair protein MutS [Robertkochia marina]|uniref:DNA mismatch repair protein MutS n=1 Tax=Robertkochia marina TaxID=1227945 RepID=A0A4S3LYM7_9FLAO|nr:Smr/MutS family protein [Robertkochia marina]THD66526.1 DNA mismatch repair protein MutS [Robertkochia marina]TRZ45632.1 DNA mismatch repair protein MutS [Robertkochia marina]
MRTFRVGDRIETVDDNIRGEVTAVSPGRIRVITEDGFELEMEPQEVLLMPESDALKVSNVDVSRAMREKHGGQKQKKKSVKREKIEPPMEVDLHIHQLTQTTRGLTNHDMLTLQLDTAKRQLEFAISKRIRRIVFIHGVGEGVLRTELEYLFGRYDNVSWYDADYQKYGLGATEVYIYQNP